MFSVCITLRCFTQYELTTCEIVKSLSVSITTSFPLNETVPFNRVKIYFFFILRFLQQGDNLEIGRLMQEPNNNC